MQINRQKTERREWDSGHELDIHSIFRTIQGEGIFAGHAAIFIRLAGCNLQCPGCDTEYTKTRARLSLEQIEEEVNRLIKGLETGLVVITGGEPFRQNISRLISLLVGVGFLVQIETNGTYPPPPDFPSLDDLYIICSPKTGKVAAELLPLIDAYKYVIEVDSIDETDGLPRAVLPADWAGPRPARPHEGFEGGVYVSPMDVGDHNLNHRNLLAAADMALRHNYILGVQLHKLVSLP